MDIFGKDRDAHQRLLDIYMEKDLMFTALRNSTLTAKGMLTNIGFDEKDYKDEVEIIDGKRVIVGQAFECDKQIITADSNFTHSKFDGWAEPTTKTKSKTV